MKFDVVRSEASILHVFPFNSEKKRGGLAVKLPNNEFHIHWKGATEIVLASCTSYLDGDGVVKPLDEDKVAYFKKAIGHMAEGSLRCVDINNVPKDEDQLEHWDLPEEDLVPLAIVGIKDPCRPGVNDAVQVCTNAGVKVRMVTGDNLQTAKAIALECGILDSDAAATEPNLIDGKVFRALSDSAQEEIAEKILVMGSSSPNDKLLLVKALKRKGHVVAVTGDDTNDAPALHEADIGLAMGIAGTEVAKESSDKIILDDNFSSVVKIASKTGNNGKLPKPNKIHTHIDGSWKTNMAGGVILVRDDEMNPIEAILFNFNASMDIWNVKDSKKPMMSEFHTFNMTLDHLVVNYSNSRNLIYTDCEELLLFSEQLSNAIAYTKGKGKGKMDKKVYNKLMDGIKEKVNKQIKPVRLWFPRWIEVGLNMKFEIHKVKGDPENEICDILSKRARGQEGRNKEDDCRRPSK